MSPSLHVQLLKWSLAILLVAAVVGAAALIQFGGVRGYAVRCEKTREISCVLQQDTSDGPQAWRIPLGATATADVQVKPSRRSRPRVFLYLNSPTRSVFAAEFEGGNEVADAHAAAARLNQVFSSAGPASAQLEVRPPAYMRPMLWAAYGFFVLLVLVILRALFKAGATA